MMTKLEQRESFFSQGQKWFHLLLAIAFIHVTMSAATLKPETVAEWEAYVQVASAQMQARLQPGHVFLKTDEDHAVAEKVRSGELLILPVGQNPHKVTGGLIHDWAGSSFIPNANIDGVLATLRDYCHYKDFFNPVVVESKTLSSDGPKDRFSMVIMNKSLVSRTALDGDYEISYVKVDDRRWYSISKVTRIQEVENYGSPGQRVLSEHERSGLIWRLLTINRFEQRDGGVYVEMEAIALSRDIPVSLRWIVTPIVRRVSKSSLLTSLQQTADAVTSRNAIAAHAPPAGEPRSVSNTVSSLR